MNRTVRNRRRRVGRAVAVVAAGVMTVAMTACTGGDRMNSPGSDPTSSTTATPPVSSATLSLFHATHFDGAWVPGTGPDFSQYTYVLRRARAALPDPSASLFLGNGDDMADLVAGVDTGGRIPVEAFNAAGLDAETYGFDEPGFGLDRLIGLLDRAEYRYVSANVRDRRTGRVYGYPQGARDWVIVNVAGVRVGITGLLSFDASRVAGDNVEIIDPVEAMRATVPAMRAAGAQLVVVLSHMETDEARAVARQVSGIDAILGTHCCDPMTQPEVVGQTIISVPPFGLSAFGRLDLTISNGRITRHALKIYDVDVTSDSDGGVERVFNRYLRSR